MQALTLCHRTFRGFSNFSHAFKLPFIARQGASPRPELVSCCYRYLYTPSATTLERFRRKYNVPEGYQMIYRESKGYINPMLFLKVSQMFVYCAPIWVTIAVYSKDATLLEFVMQPNFRTVSVILGAYLVLFHFVTSTYVEALFHNSETGLYRMFLLKRFSIGNRYIDFHKEDLKSVRLHSIIPFKNEVYKVGEHHVILFDNLFFKPEYRYELTHKALEEKEDNNQK